jgi:hydrogenase expression/formation protein HypE
MNNDTIILGHGSGGKLTHELIEKIFYKYFDNKYLAQKSDSAVLSDIAGNLAFTTDAYVVDPIFFPGGNIGKLAVCGTINDLSVSGAEPLFLSASFIIEEGFKINDLEKIVITMAEEAKKADIYIVTGDTKVVDKGKCDKIFITTSGIGIVVKKNKEIHSRKLIQSGDAIIINGPIADHGMAIIASREGFNFNADIKSDCNSLNKLIKEVINNVSGIHFMRDITRGGLATVLSEIVKDTNFGIIVNEDDIPVNENTLGMCEILGFDPMYVANEGKVIFIVSSNEALKVIDIINKYNDYPNASIIGNITDTNKGMAIMKTRIGGTRIIDMLAGEQLPRIC